MTIEPRDARVEAQQLLAPGEGQARVLEPSPPAINSGPHWADDPVDRTAVTGDGSDVELVLPTGLVDPARDPATVVDWDTWLDGRSARAEHADWLAERWLGGRRRLPATPPLETLVETRLALHRLATYVVAPVRHRQNGKFGLRWTQGGFGTPFFGQDRQVRVEGTSLIDQRDGEVRVTPIGSLEDAARFLESEIDAETAAEHDSPDVGDVDERLAVDASAAELLGNWFGMAFAGLEVLRADATSIDPSRPQLWPGHFDPAIEVGTDDTRASYGASPGDHGSDQPYLYVSVWWPDRLDIDTDDSFWNASGFTGRILPLADFPADADPAVVAANFWRETRDRIHS
ncbi:MAG: hypothetical protein OES24_18575 [Acidimicrobiia bacterium]|nr:hypothetical protein [Acidimicrobiia bacterium]